MVMTHAYRDYIYQITYIDRFVPFSSDYMPTNYKPRVLTTLQILSIFYPIAGFIDFAICTAYAYWVCSCCLIIHLFP